jgi:hypothetical protein
VSIAPTDCRCSNGISAIAPTVYRCSKAVIVIVPTDPNSAVPNVFLCEINNNELIVWNRLHLTTTQGKNEKKKFTSFFKLCVSVLKT